MISEVYDQFGRVRDSRRITAEGEKIFSQISAGVRPVPRGEGDRLMLGEKVRLCLNYAQAVYYRAHEYDRAEEIIKRCRELCNATESRGGEDACLLRPRVNYRTPEFSKPLSCSYDLVTPRLFALTERDSFVYLASLKQVLKAVTPRPQPSTFRPFTLPKLAV